MSTETATYLSFLRKFNHARRLHAATYRNGKIPGKTAKELAALPTGLPSGERLVKFIIDRDEDKYVNYTGNSHHWTTKYCWETAIPSVFDGLGLAFNPAVFRQVKFMWNDCDFSYHVPVQDMRFRVEDFVTKSKITGGYDALRNINLCPRLQYSYSLYHMLFRLSHSSGLIKNLSTESNAKLAVNCDSMSIPLIPILAPFFKETLVIDRRKNDNIQYWKKVIDFKPTHYFAIFTEYNIFTERKWHKNLFNKQAKINMKTV